MDFFETVLIGAWLLLMLAASLALLGLISLIILSLFLTHPYSLILIPLVLVCWGIGFLYKRFIG